MIWPPSKPISIRTRSSAMRHHLREDAVHGVGMDERDLQAEHALPRLLVDQLRPLLHQPGERGADVADLVGDVVHAGSAVGEELAHGRVLAERREQLDSALADADGSRLDPLVRHSLAMLETRAEQAL